MPMVADLDADIVLYLRDGWRVVHQGGGRALLERKVKTKLQFPRWIHAILILVTAGFWTVIWVLDEMKAFEVQQVELVQE